MVGNDVKMKHATRKHSQSRTYKAIACSNWNEEKKTEHLLLVLFEARGRVRGGSTLP